MKSKHNDAKIKIQNTIVKIKILQLSYAVLYKIKAWCTIGLMIPVKKI